MSAPDQHETTLSQRELRNESGRVMRELKTGTRFVVTSNGEPVGRLIPFDERRGSLPITRPATRRGGWTQLAPATEDDTPTSADVLAELRSDRL